MFINKPNEIWSFNEKVRKRYNKLFKGKWLRSYYTSNWGYRMSSYREGENFCNKQRGCLRQHGHIGERRFKK